MLLFWGRRSAGGLACSRRARAARVGLLSRAAEDADVACICEVRVIPKRLRCELRHLHREFVLHAMSEDASAGGVVVCVRRDVVADSFSHIVEVLVAGRAGVFRVTWACGGELQCIVLHNFGLRVEAMRRVAADALSGRGLNRQKRQIQTVSSRWRWATRTSKRRERATGVRPH